MKQRTSFILKGLISLALSLVMLCGTAVTSLSAVTVDIAETGALTASEYYIGSSSSGYKLVNENGWKIKDTSKTTNQYLTVSNSGNYVQISWSNSGTILTEGSASTETSAQLSCTVGSVYYSSTYYISYSNNSFSATGSDRSRVPIVVAVSSYTVTFNANGGTGTMADQTISGTANLNTNTFTREGYTFTGWNTADDGTGTSYTNGQEVTPTASITLYAQWQQDAAPASSNTLYFTNISGWNSLRAYIYNKSTGAEVSAWPGEEMHYEGNNSLGEAIYSITVDPDNYDYIVFNSGENQTVDINISDALANGAGIYYSGENNSQWRCYVNFYTYGDSSSTGDPDTITYKKQIEKLNPSNTDDYNYRLHLTVDGSALEGSTTETHGGGHNGKSLVVIIDTTETMTATSGVWNPENKFRAVQHLLQESGGLIDNFLNSGEGNTVTVIGVHGLAGTGTYTQLITEVASGTKLSDFSGDWNDSHTNHNISYVTGFLYVDDYLDNHNDEDTTVVFITGNDPMTYVSYSGGEQDPADPRITWQRGSTAKDWRSEYTAKTLEDYKKLMTEHPELTFYSVGIKPVERGDGLLVDMGEYSRSIGRGDYFSADSKDKLDDIFDTIQTIVIPADKTSNITITDTLSKYVDFASNANLTATLYTGENFATETNVSSFVTVNGGTVTFSRADEIEGPFKLEITFDIKTADGVLMDTETYGETGYPNTGDADTDYTTATSAGKRGYYSNSSATISYNLNGTTVNGTFIKPVVQAPAETPVQGAYIYKYKDRYYNGTTNTLWHSVRVPVTLTREEINGYTGNGGTAGLPTYLWAACSDNEKLTETNPAVTNMVVVKKTNDYENSVSIYKNDYNWKHLSDSAITDSNRGYFDFDAANHTVTFIADTVPKQFTFKYVVQKDSKTTVLAEKVSYGENVTFNETYKDRENSHYIEMDYDKEGFSYWSADSDGNIPLTANLTFGMVIRGGYTENDLKNDIVTVYAQYNKGIPEGMQEWNPLIEEATLTRVIDDTESENVLYSDYMVDYFNFNGKVIKDMINDKKALKYGIVIVKSADAINDQSKMEKAAKLMITKGVNSAYIGDTEHVGYRFENEDADHISNFNRTLYTLKSSTGAMEGKHLTAIAYFIDEDENQYFSAINKELSFHTSTTGE